MILWTIQSEAAVENFLRDGVLQADGRRVWRNFRPAYQWMIGQMSERLGPPPTGIHYPVWAWKSWSPETAKPDLRARAHLPVGARGARIEFEVPEESVLLSDFTRWHVVLGGDFVADSEDEYERVTALSPDLKRTIDSWSRIFELERGDPYFGKASDRRVQAALWCVKEAEVRKIAWFTAR